MYREPPRSTLFPSATLFRSSALGSVMRTFQPARANTMAHERPMRPAPTIATAGIYLLLTATAPCGAAQDRRADLWIAPRSEEHTSELQSRQYLVCRLLLEKK